MDVEELAVGVIELDRDRRVVDVNPALCRLIGHARSALVGAPVSEVLRPRTPAGADLLVAGWHRSAQLRSVARIPEQEVVVRMAGGDERVVLVDGAYRRPSPGERVEGALLTVRARGRGRRQPSSGVRIVSAVSHELRSPLTSVRGYTSLLLKRWGDFTDDDKRMMLQQIDRDARRISRMIGELLDISRLEGGRLALHRAEVDLAQLVDDVIDAVRRQWPALDVDREVAAGLHDVWADGDKVRQVLTNLLENACKYSDPTGVVVRASRIGADVVVEVADRGPGIPPADLPLLFQQFFRSSEGRPSGTGLGLWISRGIIEAHGGRLTADSTVQGGSTFRFTLPQARGDDADVPRRPAGRGAR